MNDFENLNDCDEKKYELEKMEACKVKVLRRYVWNWITRTHLLLSDCQKNSNLHKFILKGKTHEEFVPKLDFKYPKEYL